MNEHEIIDRIRQLFPQRAAKIGIGDDAAVIGEQVITTDMLLEDVDFTRAVPIECIARKSLSSLRRPARRNRWAERAVRNRSPVHPIVRIVSYSGGRVPTRTAGPHSRRSRRATR